jgi:hypothetical protein
MKRYLKFYVFLFPLIVLIASVSAQTPEKIEQDLVSHIKDVKKHSAYQGNYDGDLLSKANENFKSKLLKYAKQSAVLKHKFSELDKHIDIATSEDGKFRIYTWDTESGGTMHMFDSVFQFQGSDGKVYSKGDYYEEGDAGAFISDIYGIDTKRGKVYLARMHSILSTSDSYQTVKLFKISGGSIQDVKLIKTSSGLTNLLSFEYNFFSVVDRKERPIRLFEYDIQTKTIKFPVVIEDKEFPNGKVTDKFIKYKFNGTYFVKTS